MRVVTRLWAIATRRDIEQIMKRVIAILGLLISTTATASDPYEAWRGVTGGDMGVYRADDSGPLKLIVRPTVGEWVSVGLSEAEAEGVAFFFEEAEAQAHYIGVTHPVGGGVVHVYKSGTAMTTVSVSAPAACCSTLVWLDAGELLEVSEYLYEAVEL